MKKMLIMYVFMAVIRDSSTVDISAYLYEYLFL